MPTLRVPLVGVANQRTVDGTNTITLGQDQRFVNCVFDVVKNPITGKSTFYISKRPGFIQNSLVSAGNISTGLIKTDILGTIVTAFATPNSTIFDGQTSVGTITGEALHFWETVLSNGIGYVMIKSSDGTGWYYPSDAKNQTTYTGTTTAANVQVDAITSTSGIYAGELLTGANIGAAARVSSVLSTTQVIMTVAASGTGNAAITKEPIAKILSANLVTTGTNKAGFVDLDGFILTCAEDGFLQNSDLNTVEVYTASNKIAVNISPDLPQAIARHKNLIVVFGTASTEVFHNAGNPAGSPLSSDAQYFQRVGIQNQRSLAHLKDDIYFVTSSRDGDLQVNKMSNLSMSKISTAAIDRIIGTANASGSVIYVSAFTLYGMPHVLLQIASVAFIGTNFFLLQESGFNLLQESASDKLIIDAATSSTTALSRELIYNAELNIWCEWDSPLLTFVKGVGAGSVNQIIATSRINTSGKIYGINPSSDTEVYQDDGASYTLSIQTSKFDFGTDNRKHIQAVSLIGDQQTSGSVTLEYSDDDFQTWKTAGTFDKTKKVQNITRLGSFKGSRAWRLTDSGNDAFRAQALEFDYTLSNV